MELAKLRDFWDRWGALCVAALTVLGAIVGTTYYLSIQIGSLKATQEEVGKLHREIDETKKAIDVAKTIAADNAAKAKEIEVTVQALQGNGNIDRLTEGYNRLLTKLDNLTEGLSRLQNETSADSVRYEQLTRLQEEYLVLRNEHGQRFESLSEKVNDLAVKLARIEAKATVDRLSQAGEFKGGSITGPDGTEENYAPDDAEKFKKDAYDAIDAGGGVSSKLAQWVPGGGCLPRPPPDCVQIQVSLGGDEADRIATINARFLSNQNRLTSKEMTAEEVIASLKRCFDGSEKVFRSKGT